MDKVMVIIMILFFRLPDGLTKPPEEISSPIITGENGVYNGPRKRAIRVSASAWYNVEALNNVEGDTIPVSNPSLPTVPSDLSFTANSKTTLTLSWTVQQPMPVLLDTWYIRMVICLEPQPNQLTR